MIIHYCRTALMNIKEFRGRKCFTLYGLFLFFIFLFQFQMAEAQVANFHPNALKKIDVV